MRETLKAFYYRNSNLLVVTDARTTATGGTIINNALGTAEVLDKHMLSVPGGGPIALTYVPASQGRYEGTFDANVDVEVGDFVNVEVLLEIGILKYRGIIQASVKA